MHIPWNKKFFHVGKKKILTINFSTEGRDIRNMKDYDCNKIIIVRNKESDWIDEQIISISPSKSSVSVNNTGSIFYLWHKSNVVFGIFYSHTFITFNTQKHIIWTNEKYTGCTTLEHRSCIDIFISFLTAVFYITEYSFFFLSVFLFLPFSLSLSFSFLSFFLSK